MTDKTLNDIKDAAKKTPGTSKAAKAFAVMQYVSGIQDFDHALKIFEALGKTFGPVDDVLYFYDTMRFHLYDCVSGEEYWEMIETSSLLFDDAVEHFRGEEK